MNYPRPSREYVTRVVWADNGYKSPGLIIQIGPVDYYYLFYRVYFSPGERGRLVLPPFFPGGI